MSERRKQTHFFKQLMQLHDCAQCREMQVRLSQAERQERRIRLALGWATFLVCLSGAGLGYSAVVLHEFFTKTRPISVEVFSFAFVASVVSLLGFVCFWCWRRRLCNGLYDECRRLLLRQERAKAVT